MSHFVKHTQCPKCALLGKDKHNDNLGNYSDGSTHCFSCGYTTNGSAIQKFKESTQPRNGPTNNTCTLPGDVSTTLPEKAWQWLRKYSLTEQDIKQHNILWSDYEQRVVFPIFGNNEELLAWQGRYLGEDPGKGKWYSRGNLKQITHIIGYGKRETLVLVEDLISAIRIGTTMVHSMPLFGSHIGMDRWQQLRLLNFQNIIIWLDKDKQIDSIKFAKQARDIGISVRSVITDKDPKEYSNDEIKTFLT